MSDIRFESLGPADYERAKTVLNRAKHPGFVGRELYFRCATTGTCTIAVLDEKDVGVALVAKDKLQAMSVVVAAQSRGVGGALIARVQPRWVNAIGERVPWFEKRGYKCVGAPRVSQNGKHAQQLMERTDAALQAGEISDTTLATSKPKEPEEPEEPTPTFLELLDELPEERAKAQLQILDGLMQKAILAERFDSCLKLMETADTLLKRHGRR